ncbi:thiamine phosphate synthase [Leeuwenhoekiella sp. LLG6367-2.1]|uniref:thiamine phosphate synthase n=1 Tax=Leeuwenhoekiella sp. LLG6367-2.1 TaxID=3160833 RepID=UPI0038665B87
MLIVITSEAFLSAEITQIKQMIDLGLKCVHVRKPQATLEELRNWLQNFEPRFLATMMLHQHHVLGEELGCKGVHFKEYERNTQDKTFKKKLKNCRSNGYQVSTSFHKLDDLKSNAVFFDYAFLSPVFTSISKVGYEGIQFDVQDIPENCIALGGITSEKIEEAYPLGFCGVAVLGAIWLSKNPVNEFIKIKNQYEYIYN